MSNANTRLAPVVICGILVAMIASRVSSGTVDCSSPESQSHGCSSCGLDEADMLWKKCGDPNDSSHCPSAEYNSVPRRCAQNDSKACPGDKRKYLSSDECESNGELIGIEDCHRVYSTAAADNGGAPFPLCTP